MERKKLKLIVLAVFVLIGLFLLPITPISKSTKLFARASFPPVLMYHDIKPEPVNGFDVSVEDFRKQLDWLQQQGYRTLSAEEFASCIREQSFQEKVILITFDDGYQGVYTYAAPELKKRQMQAVFFIIPAALDKALYRYPYLTSKQVRELAADENFAIQSHSENHKNMVTLSAGAIKDEVVKSKQEIEALTKRPCELLAYPVGNYNKQVVDAVVAAGYTAAFAVNDKGILDEPLQYSIPRIYMGVAMGKDNLKLFKRSVEHYKEMPKEAFAERYKFLKK